MAEDIIKSQFMGKMKQGPVNQSHAGSNITGEGWKTMTSNGTDMSLGSVYKSIIAEENPELSKAMGESEFLSMFVESIAKSFDVIGDVIFTKFAEQNADQVAFNESMHDIVKSVVDSMEEVAGETEKIADETVEKSMQDDSDVIVHSAPGDAGPEAPEYTRDMIMKSLDEMYRTGECSDIDVIRYETEGVISKSISAKLGLPDNG